ncbi:MULTISPECIES: IS66 family insertion sequence element accessory protein TnpB [unclassified Rhizobium]|uniref:IS66 family insertion sequence element accessory protein TnpB n=2 Tax=unclassified Rhizobium TaxID=2613769 RepID=UPI001ADC61BE|nr:MULTISPECIES: IS66 family insertion sequence element accessory protein TnpB [unclassified Rhizobium]MBO9187950.1 IS66 family insertion sequence element accessory protein TnpB [Rhizobium sp. E27B/91]QXZ87528.1 IS66 family insertion sequence element accessory protein TnpB [Rhizobium sp. K1/93]QXZ93568.1 IS66 family insertion sequence element accessory protein TnpB [Rhizobium sp. K15/93]
MIGPSGNVRVYLACGVTDMRRGIDGLSTLAETVIKEAPGSGAIFGFRGKRADRIKLLWWDGQGFCLFYNDLNSYCITLLASVEGFDLASALVKRGDAINELVPSTALLLR